MNLFVRHAGGLAVFSDLGRPYGFDLGRQVIGARDLTVALSGNYEGQALGPDVRRLLPLLHRRLVGRRQRLQRRRAGLRRRSASASTSTPPSRFPARSAARSASIRIAVARCCRWCCAAASCDRGAAWSRHHSQPIALRHLHAVAAQRRRAVLPVAAAGLSARGRRRCTTWGWASVVVQ